MRVPGVLAVGVVSLGALLGAQQIVTQRGGGPPAASAQLQTPATRTAAISGVVTDAVTKRPVAGAVVQIGPGANRAGGNTSVQLTDERGRFVFVELAAFPGYVLNIHKAGYAPGHYGRTPAGASIAIADGQWMNTANVALNRLAVIAGTVTDEHGAPVAGAYVRLVREYPLAGRPHFAAGPVVETNDRGEYRLSGLDPGRYIVAVPSPQHSVPASTAAMQRITNTTPQDAARLQSEGRPLSLGVPLLEMNSGAHLAIGRYPLPTPGSDGRPLSYRALYFPDSASFDDASRIEVRYNDERGGVDFHLQPVSTVRVSGIVEGPPDALSGIILRLMPAGMEDLGGFGTEAAASPIGDGNRFTFLNVAPGSYVIVARRTASEVAVGTAGSYMPSATNQGASFGMSITVGAGLAPSATDARLTTSGTRGTMAYGARLPISVNSDSVDNLVVSMQKGSTLTARVVKEGNVPGNPTLAIDPADGSPSLMPGQAPGPQTTTVMFTFEGLMSGQYFLRNRGMGPIKSIMWQGRDYADRPFDLTEAKEVADVIVTVTDQGATLSGTVRNGSGVPAAEAVVTVFPAERDQWIDYGMSPARIKWAQTSTSGTYRIPGLPAGDYLIVAAMDIDPTSWREPGFLERVAPQGTKISVAWGQTPTQDVVVSTVR